MCSFLGSIQFKLYLMGCMISGALYVGQSRGMDAVESMDVVRIKIPWSPERRSIFLSKFKKEALGVWVGVIDSYTLRIVPLDNNGKLTPVLAHYEQAYDCRLANGIKIKIFNKNPVNHPSHP